MADTRRRGKEKHLRVLKEAIRDDWLNTLHGRTNDVGTQSNAKRTTHTTKDIKQIHHWDEFTKRSRSQRVRVLKTPASRVQC